MIRKVAYAPKHFTCPYCSVKARRQKKWTKRYRDIEYHREAYLDVTYGAYYCGKGCMHYFVGETKWAGKQCDYTNAVRQAVINSLVRDRMNYIKLKKRMKEDFLLTMSLSTLFAWFNEAAQQPNFFKQFEEWSSAQFSGVVCIDEVYEGKKRIFIATDCLNDLPLCFMISDKADKHAVNNFFEMLDNRNVQPVVAITDGSPLYKASLREHWQHVEHQLCIFHVLKNFNKIIIDEVRSTRRILKRQSNKGRKNKRGRPSKQAKYQRERRTSKKEEATFIWEHQYLLVKKRCYWSDEDKQSFKRLCKIKPKFKIMRNLVEQFHGLFERDSSKHKSRYRRTQLLNNPTYHKLGCFDKITRLICKSLFEKMIVFMDYENVDRASNHVERINRTFRMMQKTRYKRRTVQTITNAIRHEWMYLMKHHPLNADQPSEPMERHFKCNNRDDFLRKSA